jgi:DNA integrity scanning protein DisA with diadenylate cyclase activity
MNDQEKSLGIVGKTIMVDLSCGSSLVVGVISRARPLHKGSTIVTGYKILIVEGPTLDFLRTKSGELWLLREQFRLMD